MLLARRQSPPANKVALRVGPEIDYLRVFMVNGTNWTRVKGLVFLVAGGLLGAAGCSSGDDSGACVHTPKGSGHSYCNNGWDKEECDTIGSDSETRVFHPGDECDEHGHSYYCADTDTYHRDSSTCD